MNPIFVSIISPGMAVSWRRYEYPHIHPQEDEASVLAVRRRIFYVEDNQDAAEMVRLILTEAGYEVNIALTLEESLPLIKRCDFDLLLLDNWFAGGSGLALCKAVRAYNREIPIAFLSSAAYAKDIQEGLAAGADAYLTKPVDIDLMLETIRRLVGGNKRLTL